MEKLARKYLSKPLEAYPRYDTPASRDLPKHYEKAIDERGKVDGELVKSY